MHPGKMLFNRVRVKWIALCFWPKIRTKLASSGLLQNCWANFYGRLNHISEIISAQNAPGKILVSQGQSYMESVVRFAEKLLRNLFRDL